MINLPHIQKLNHRKTEIAAQIYTVFQRAYRVEAELIKAAVFPPLNRTLAAMQISETSFFGYWKGETLAAVVEIDFCDHQLEICSLVVDPDFFRQGIGSELLQKIIDHFNFDSAIVETAVANDPAVALYEKLGFVANKTWLTDFGITKIELILK